MKTSFYCVKCRKLIESEILEVQEKGGRRYAKGECKICGTNLSVVIPNNLKVDSKPYEEDIESPEIEEIKKKIGENEKKLKEERIKLKEEKEVESYVKEVDDNPTLKKYNYLVVKRSFYRFLKVIMILFFLFLLVMAGLLVFTGYELYKNRLDFKGLVSPIFENDIMNNYDFNPSTNNNYQHDIDARNYNNISVNIKFCNGTTPC